MARSTSNNNKAVDLRRPNITNISTSVTEFHHTMKISLLLKDDLPDFLAIAPLAVSLLGHLRLFAWSTAATVEIEINEGSLFTSNRMSLNLLQLHQQGRKMFEIAHDQMSMIEDTMQSLFSKAGIIAHIFDCLKEAHPNSKRTLKTLPRYLDALRTGMESCVSAAGVIANEIKILQGMAFELEIASLDEFTRTERKLAAEKVDLDYLKLDEKHLNETMESLEEFLQKAEKQYEDAQKKQDEAEFQSGGWATFGLVALTSITNPIVKSISHATNLIKDVPDLVGKFARLSVGFHTTVDSADQGSSKTSTEDLSRGGQLAGHHAKRNATDEIVCQKIYEISLLVINIQEFPTDKGVIDGYLAEVHKHRSDIQPATSPRSRDAMTILNHCEKVLMDMRKSTEIVKMNRTKEMTEEEKNWSKRMANAHSLTVELETWAQSQPGEALGAPTPLLNNIATRLVREDNSLNTNSILVKRQEDLMRMRILCSAAADNYQKKINEKARHQAQIREVTRKLTRIQNDQASAEKIRAVLRSAGEMLGKLQIQVQGMLRYFETLSRIISSMQNLGSKKLIETINDGLDSSEPGQGLLFTEFQAQVLYTYLLVLRGHATVIASSCSFYVEVSGKHLRPLSNAMGDLPLNPDDARRKDALEKLERDIEAASNTIITRGAERISDIRQQIEEMGNTSGSQEDVPELPISRKRAIEASVRKISQEMGQEVNANERKGPAALVDDILPDL